MGACCTKEPRSPVLRGTYKAKVVKVTDGDTVELKDVSGCLRADATERPRDASLAEVEKAHILSVLTDAGGNKAKAARTLGVDVKTLYNKLKKYGMPITE